MSSFLMKKFSKLIKKIEICSKEDLELMNHLSGLKQNYLKLLFNNVNDLMKLKKEVVHYVEKNKKKIDLEFSQLNYNENMFDQIYDIREYDVPYHVRVAIDNKFNVVYKFTKL